MAKYNIEIELSDYGVFKALQFTEWGHRSGGVSSSNYIDVRDALYEALKEEVDLSELEENLDMKFWED